MKLSRKQLENLVKDTYLDHKGKNLYGRCPKCGELEFGISLEDNHRFNCFRKKHCGFTGNIFTLLKFLGKSKEFDTDTNVFDSKLKSLNTPLQQPTPLPSITPPILWRRFYESEYLRERGFTDDQFHKFEVGESKIDPDYVTFLIRMRGEVVGYVSRSKKSREWIDEFNRKQKQKGSQLVYLRYKNSTTDFSKCLFGYDEIVEKTSTVILVEGIFSKTKTDINLGLDNLDELKCCATFGAKISGQQIELLKQKNIQNIILWFEADVLKQVKQAGSELGLHFKVSVGYLDGKDPGDLNQEEALSVLENVEDYLSFNINRLQRI